MESTERNCNINISSSIGELKGMLNERVATILSGKQPFTEQTHIAEMKQMMQQVLAGLSETAQLARSEEKGVDPSVGVELHDGGVVFPNYYGSPNEGNVQDLQGVDWEDNYVNGMLSNEIIDMHVGQLRTVQEVGDMHNNRHLALEETYASEESKSLLVQFLSMKNVAKQSLSSFDDLQTLPPMRGEADNVHPSAGKVAQTLGAGQIVTGTRKGRGRGRGRGVEAADVGDMHSCNDSKISTRHTAEKFPSRHITSPFICFITN